MSVLVLSFNIIRILTTVEETVRMSNAEERMLIMAKPRSTFISKH